MRIIQKAGENCNSKMCEIYKIWQQFSHAKIIVQNDRGSLLTKGILYNYFCMAELLQNIRLKRGKAKNAEKREKRL